MGGGENAVVVIDRKAVHGSGRISRVRSGRVGSSDSDRARSVTI